MPLRHGPDGQQAETCAIGFRRVERREEIPEHGRRHAGTVVAGQSAEQYLTQSILEPNAHVVEGFPQGVMPSYKGVLSDAELKDVVAYLLTLK